MNRIITETGAAPVLDLEFDDLTAFERRLLAAYSAHNERRRRLNWDIDFPR
jgi:hypothetical protein